MTRETLAVGVDLGGTKMAAAIVSSEGRILARTILPTGAERGPEAVVADLIGSVRELCARWSDRGVLGLGVGVAGQVASGSGRVAFAPNLRWEGFPLGDRLREALDLPVAVLNDVQAATVGEHEFGAGRGVAELICLFIGTGVGGGVIAGNRLLQGCGGSAAELGHVAVELEGEPCHCGSRGCLEAYVGGWAIIERARRSIAAGSSGGAALLAAAGGDPGAITASVLAAAARTGNPLAREILLTAERALGVGAASIVNAFNPCLLVLGGGVVQAVPQLIPAAEAGVHARALRAAAAVTRIEGAALGSDAGSLGAAVWARRTLAPA
jgi:glucokinase